MIRIRSLARHIIQIIDASSRPKEIVLGLGKVASETELSSVRDVIMAMSPSDAIINFNPEISKNKHKHNLVKLVQNMNDTRNPFFGLNMYVIVQKG